MDVNNDLSNPTDDSPMPDEQINVEVETVSLNSPEAARWLRGHDKRVNDVPKPKEKKTKFSITVGPDLDYLKEGA